MGGAIILAPNFFLGLLAGSLLFLGVALTFVAWKFLSLQRRIMKTFSGFDGRISIQGVTMNAQGETRQSFRGMNSMDEKKAKITYH